MVKTALLSAMGVGKSRKASELRRKLLGGPSALLVDPLGFDAGDSNLYRYVNNQPVTQTDPSGDISLFFGGAGSDEHGNMKRLRERIAEPSFYFKVPEGAPSMVPLLKQADERIDVAIKENPNEKINLFGYSRGAIFALAYAFKLINKNKLKINFVCLLDPVTTALRNVELQVLWGKSFAPGDRRLGELNKENVKLLGAIQHTFIARSDREVTLNSIFTQLWGVEKTNKDQTLVQKTYKDVSHTQTNRSEDILKDALKAMADAGVPLKKQ